MSLPSLPARHSLLSASALGMLVAELWQLDEPLQCHLFQNAQSGGNDLYLVTSRTERFILRVYLRSDEALEIREAQAKMMDVLAQQNVAVNRPVHLVDGTFTTSVEAAEGVRYLQLFVFVPGTAPGWQITEEQAMHYGQTVAHLHKVADGLPHISALPTLDEEALLLAPARIIASFLDGTSLQAQELKKLTILLQRRLSSLSRTLPAYGFCHADCHKMNLLCTQDEQLTLIDFDCAGYSWRAYELSILLWSLSRTTDSGNQIYDQRIWDAYLSGYQDIRTLGAQIVEAIPWFVLVRHLWWMAIDLRKIQQELMGRSWLDAAWFERNLNRLRQWMLIFSLS